MNARNVLLFGVVIDIWLRLNEVHPESLEICHSTHMLFGMNYLPCQENALCSKEN